MLLFLVQLTYYNFWDSLIVVYSLISCILAIIYSSPTFIPFLAVSINSQFFNTLLTLNEPGLRKKFGHCDTIFCEPAGITTIVSQKRKKFNPGFHRYFLSDSF